MSDDRNPFFAEHNTGRAGLDSEATPANGLAAGESGASIRRTLSYHPVREIALALGVSKPTARKRARDEQWPVRGSGNREEFAPPADIAARCLPRVTQLDRVPEPEVEFTALANPITRLRTTLRLEAVTRLRDLIAANVPKELALANVVLQFTADPRAAQCGFTASPNILRRWDQLESRYGVNGLVEQRQGKTGRKAMEIPEDIRRLGMAAAIEYGSVARATRDLMRSPLLPAHMREHVHEGHASKSYVTPALRAAITPAPIVADLIQGKKHTRVNSLSSIHAHHDDLHPGQVFVADDMTPNIYVWEPWPGPLGYRIGRPQILQFNDVATMMPLKVNVIMRASGAYTSDDVAGTMGSIFDTIGLPDEGFILEGGVWRGNKVLGHRTGVSDDDRIGGLASLGLKVWWARTPGAKWEIEGPFNQIQHIMDRCPGYCGREEKNTLPEALKKRLAEADHGITHPSTFLLSVDQFAEHVQAALREFAHERQDGKTLRGQSPFEAWHANRPELRQIPEHAKWIYRSAFSKVTVTQHGVRCTQGSGRFVEPVYYHNPALLEPRRGQTVAVYWNDRLPESDAAIMAIDGANRHFLGMAQYQPEISRLHSTKEERDAAFATKRAQLAYAKSVIKDIEPHLTRQSRPVATDAGARFIGQQMAESARVAEERREVEREQAREEQRVTRRAARVSAEDALAELAPISSAPTPSDERPVSLEELDEL